MIFSKTLSSAKTNNPKNISILGDSALGLIIADNLQNIGHKINIICSPQTVDEYNATDFIFKDPRLLQHHRTNFFFSFEQTASPDLLIIASDLEKLRQDLLLLSTSKVQNSLILNLFPYSPQTMLKEILGSAPIESRNFSLSWKHQNTICNSEYNTTLYLPSDCKEHYINSLSEIFENTKIEIETSEKFDSFHWEWISIRIALMLCQHLRQSAKTINKDTNLKTQINNCLNEISYIASLKSQNINTGKITAALQNIQDNQNIIPLRDSTSYDIFAERIFNIIFQDTLPDDKRFPLLKMIFNKT
ncbi:MAG: hypothetical protein IKL33_03115 [Alphaproteobacteria bacterium]|nr:hypothetical protein [Alphaproteobacteria bacterium]